MFPGKTGSLVLPDSPFALLKHTGSGQESCKDNKWVCQTYQHL